jgi:hypothetical protein
MKSSAITVAGCVAVFVTGCANMMNVGPAASLNPTDRFTTFGANPIHDSNQFELVDLVTLLDPEGHRKYSLGALYRETHPYPKILNIAKDTVADATHRAELEHALHAFSTRYDESSVASRIAHVQDRLIAASEQRCGTYKIYLKRFEVYTDTTLGVSSLIAGGVGAVVSSTGVAQKWAALSGLLGGSRAEIRQGMFANLASYVIIPGIEAKRREIHNEILSKRNDGGGLVKYNIEAALADAARFHAACSLETGLEHAKDSIQMIESPGQKVFLRAMNAAYVQRQAVNAYQQLGNTPPTTAVKIVPMDTSLADPTSGAPTANGSATTVAEKPQSKRTAVSLMQEIESTAAEYALVRKRIQDSAAEAKKKKCEGDGLMAHADVETVRSAAVEKLPESMFGVEVRVSNTATIQTFIQFESAMNQCAVTIGEESKKTHVNYLRAASRFSGELTTYAAYLSATKTNALKGLRGLAAQLERCEKLKPSDAQEIAKKALAIANERYAGPTLADLQITANTTDSKACNALQKS